MSARTWVWGASVGVLGASFVLSRAAAEHGPVICPFRLVTGLPCPGCGLMRSFVAVAHGELGVAFERNLFGPILFAALAIFVAWYGAELVMRRPLGLGRALAASRMGLWIVAGLWLGWGAVRFVRALADGGSG